MKGRILTSPSGPRSKFIVRAFHRRLRAEASLAQTTTECDGSFEIEYRWKRGKEEECERPDLVIRVYDEDGEQVAGPVLILNAGAEESVELTVDPTDEQDLTEYERVSSKLEEVLEDHDIEDLDRKDREFLVAKTGLKPPIVELLVRARELALPEELEPAVLYALLRQRLPEDWEELLRLPASRLRDAVRSAVDESIVPDDPTHPGQIQRLKELRVEKALGDEDGPDARLAAVTQIVGLEDDARRDLLAHFFESDETPPHDVIAEAREAGTVDDAQAVRLEHTFELAEVTGHLPLVEALLEDRGDQDADPAHLFSRFSLRDWLHILEQVPNTPDDVAGDTERERKAAYARRLNKKVRENYPTPALAAGLRRQGELEGAEAVANFLDENPDFALEKQSVSSYLRENPEAIGDSDADARAREQLEEVQRAFRLAPASSRVETVPALLSNGYNSARAILAGGRNRFVDRTAGKLEPETAREIYHRAQHTEAVAKTVALNHAARTSRTLPRVLVPDPDPEVAEEAADQGLPDWETLFGGIDFCECRHCRSVYGPAAYLVDVLQYLDEWPSDDGNGTALDALFERRADLAHIELSCENTNTVLPYVDLVLEILEWAVASATPAGLQTRDDSPQTTWPTEDLLLAPEHVIPGAYDTLAEACHPWELPFDLWLEQARAGLEAMGAPRQALISAFLDDEAVEDDSGAVIDPGAPAEVLGVSTREWELLTRHQRDPEYWKCWGFESGTDWVQRLSTTTTFLERSGLTYEDAQGVLEAQFVDPSQTVRIDFAPDAPCDLDRATVTGLTEDVAHRVHRFVRLRDALGWTSAELDHALDVLDATQMHANLLVELSRIERIRAKHDLPVEEVLAWWEPISTTPVSGDRSLYEKLFLDPTVGGAADPVFDVNAIAGGGAPLADWTGTVRGALGLEADEHEALLPLLAGAPDLNLDNLSILYRHASLSRVLGTGVEDLRILVELTGINPFQDPAKAEEFLTLAARLEGSELTPAQLGYVFAHDATADGADAPEPNAAQAFFQTLRSELRAIDEQPAASADGGSPDPDAERTAQVARSVSSEFDLELELAQLLVEALVLDGDAHPVLEAFFPVSPGEAVEFDYDPPAGDPIQDQAATNLTGDITGPTLISGSWSGDQVKLEFDEDVDSESMPAPNDFTVRADGTKLPVSAVAISGDEVLLTLASKPSPGNTVDFDYDAAGSASPLRDLAGNPANPYFGKGLSHDGSTTGKTTSGTPDPTLVSAVASYDTLTLIYDEPLDQSSVPPPGAFRVRVDNTDVPITEVTITDERVALTLEPPAHEEAYTVLDKVTRLVLDLDLSAIDLEWILESGPSTWLDFGTLPPDTGSVTSPATQTTSWLHLLGVYGAAAELGLPAGAVPELLDTASLTDQDEALELLAGWTEWTKGELGAVTQALELGFPGDWEAGDALVRLSDALAVIEELGVPAEQAVGWIDAPDFDQARNILGALRQQVGADAWPTRFQPLRDGFREAQRKALVAYLSTRYGLEDEEDLYAHFLIDVEMSPCQKTTRIKQAIASAQLFVQRAFLGLERDLTATGDETEQWEWMKNYRVWEANRKVFLYPENWIEPELRIDKTPFFEEMESQILQNEITPEAVEKAYLDYLWKLDEVARLEVAGVHHHMEDRNGNVIGPLAKKATDVVHVFARTRSEPRTYFYRRREDGSRWTPWEKLDLDIEGDHLLPVMYNRRLHLLWPTWVENAVRKGQGKDARYEKYHEIRLAWSRLEGNRWTKKRVTREARKAGPRAGEDARVPSEKGPWLVSLAPSRHHFWARQESGELIVSLFRARWLELEFEHESGLIADGRFRFTGCDGAAEVEDDLGPYLQDDGWMWRRQPMYAHFDGSAMRQVPDAAADKFALDAWKVLGRTPSRFRVIQAQKQREFIGEDVFFYEDDDHCFFVDPTLTLISVFPEFRIRKTFTFHDFHHPYVCTFIRQLNRFGLDGILAPDRIPEDEVEEPDMKRQALEEDSFEVDYDPMGRVKKPYPRDEVDFSWTGAYSDYNWELFFHAPLLVAERLRDDGRYAEALDWLHYIFDPISPPTDTTGSSDAKQYWRTRPFYEELDTRPISEALALLGSNPTDPEEKRRKKELELQVEDWRKHPFEPHRIARLRPVAYMKTVVMKYLDTLIEWGDHLFRKDTMESINRATQLYLMARELLGRRPERIDRDTTAPRTFHEIRGTLDAFSNVLVGLENELSPGVELPDNHFQANGHPEPRPLRSLYFCVPENPELLGYWDTVEDRLFKIRHCMNIEGVKRELPLFEPPIDPALLVKARAAGLDIGAALSDLSAPLPNYRFSVLVQRAKEFAAEVRSLGGALLSALEKKDAEELSRLRQSHEIQMLSAVRQVKEQRVEEAESALEALERTRELTEFRMEHYRSLELEYSTDKEKAQVELIIAATILELVAQGVAAAAAFASNVPDVGTGTSGNGVYATATFGGSTLANVARAVQSGLSAGAGVAHAGANLASIQASRDRREERWQFQADTAGIELERIDEQILGAEIRLAIAERELENHELRVESAKQVESWMKDKFTNQELYGWMSSQLSTVHNEAYQLAYDMAKRAERAYRFELAEPGAFFVEFGNWKGQKSGLLAAERLQHQLRSMEAAYLDRNERQFELTKHVSLARLDPVALLALKETGECGFTLPEALFDLDHPGHYLRRIKSVSLTVPCVTGPYTGVHCGLTLLSSRVRTSDELDGGAYPRNPSGGSAGDDRFREYRGAVHSIATSHGRSDAGVFELSFRDERYLPFEGAGVADSDWHLELTSAVEQFDRDSISDVILELRYTAEPSTSTGFRTAAADYARAQVGATDGQGGSGSSTGSLGPLASLASFDGSSVRMFSARHDFPTAWHHFLHSFTGTSAAHALQLDLGPERFPQWTRSGALEFDAVGVAMKLREGTVDALKDASSLPVGGKLSPPGVTTNNDVDLAAPTSVDADLLVGVRSGGDPAGDWSLTFEPAALPSPITVDVDGQTRLDPDAVEDLFAVVLFARQSGS